MRLDGRTILVTGASSGLGRAMAAAFVSEGANVACAARSPGPLTAATDEMNEGAAGEAVPIPADVRSWEDVTDLVDETRERFGAIDVLVNNAGGTKLDTTADESYLPVQEVPIATWERVVDTNLGGVFRCTKAVLPEMLTRDAGRLIHMASGHGVEGRARRAPYTAAKYGLEGFQDCLTLELAETGVETLLLRPPAGGVYTERAGKIGRSRESFPHEDPAVVAEPAVRLAGGEGENGGRYIATADGEDFSEYSR